MPAVPLRVVCAILRDEQGRVLAAQRPPGKAQAGKWEFPGGKIEPGESPEAALIRELTEELDIVPDVGGAWPPVRHEAPAFLLELLPFEASARGRSPSANEHAELRWISPASPEWLLLDWAEADLPIVHRLAAES